MNRQSQPKSQAQPIQKQSSASSMSSELVNDKPDIILKDITEGTQATVTEGSISDDVVDVDVEANTTTTIDGSIPTAQHPEFHEVVEENDSAKEEDDQNQKKRGEKDVNDVAEKLNATDNTPDYDKNESSQHFLAEQEQESPQPVSLVQQFANLSSTSILIPQEPTGPAMLEASMQRASSTNSTNIFDANASEGEHNTRLGLDGGLERMGSSRSNVQSGNTSAKAGMRISNRSRQESVESILEAVGAEKSSERSGSLRSSGISSVPAAAPPPPGVPLNAIVVDLEDAKNEYRALTSTLVGPATTREQQRSEPGARTEASAVTASLRQNKNEYTESGPGSSSLSSVSMSMTANDSRSFSAAGASSLNREDHARRGVLDDQEEIVFECDDDDDSSMATSRNNDDDNVAALMGGALAQENLIARLRRAAANNNERNHNNLTDSDDESLTNSRQRSSSAFMVEATLVPDLEEAVVIQDLNEFAANQNMPLAANSSAKHEKTKKQRRIQCLVGAVAFIALVIALSVSLSNNGDSSSSAFSSTTSSTQGGDQNNPTENSSTAAPTLAATTAPTTPSPTTPAPTKAPTNIPTDMPTLAPSVDPILYYGNAFELLLPNVERGDRRLTRLGGDEGLQYQAVRSNAGSSGIFSIWQFLNQPDILLLDDEPTCVRYGDLIFIKAFGVRRRHIRGLGGGSKHDRQLVHAADCITQDVNFCGFTVSSKESLQNTSFWVESMDPRFGECVRFDDDIYITHPNSRFLAGGISVSMDSVMTPAYANVTEVADNGLWKIQRVVTQWLMLMAN